MVIAAAAMESQAKPVRFGADLARAVVEIAFKEVPTAWMERVDSPRWFSRAVPRRIFQHAGTLGRVPNARWRSPERWRSRLSTREWNPGRGLATRAHAPDRRVRRSLPAAAPTRGAIATPLRRDRPRLKPTKPVAHQSRRLPRDPSRRL